MNNTFPIVNPTHLKEKGKACSTPTFSLHPCAACVTPSWGSLGGFTLLFLDPRGSGGNPLKGCLRTGEACSQHTPVTRTRLTLTATSRTRQHAGQGGHAPLRGGLEGQRPSRKNSLPFLPLLFPLGLHAQNHFFHLLHQLRRADADEGLACVHVLVVGEVQGVDNAFRPVVAQ